MVIPAGYKGVRKVVNPLLGSNPKSGSFPELVVVAHWILLLIWIFPEETIGGFYWY